MVDYIKSMLFPFIGKENMKNFAIGAIINIFWFLIMPFFFVLGYLVKLSQHTLQELDGMPSWTQPLEILKHGLSAFTIFVGYTIVPLLLGFFTIRNIPDVSGIFFDPSIISSIPSFAIVATIVSGILFFLAILILPMAFINYAATESLKQAFNIPSLLVRLRKRLFGYIITYVITFVAILLFMLTLLVPFAQIISGIILFYALVFIIHTFSQIYLEAENL